MKRDPALASLSREHHQALFVAQRLRRVSGETADDARAAFLTYWDDHGHHHFRIEEEVLLPAFAAREDPHQPVVARVLCDHVAIRQRADALRRTTAPTVSDLHALGVALDAHVRLEERELFALIEDALPEDELATLGERLEDALGEEGP
jgi:hypothetical protein